VLSVFGDDSGLAMGSLNAGQGRDVRLRAAINHMDLSAAERLTREVNALYTCGPAGGGGVRTSLRPRLGLDSSTVARHRVRMRHAFVEESA
jgi:hypothetical protein